MKDGAASSLSKGTLEAIRDAHFFDAAFIDLPCPRCGYPAEVQLLDVRLRSRLFCPCCKMGIQLVDDRGVDGRGLRQAEAAQRRLGFSA